jgi:tetratricopeptide (TPR) repeat protein/predicted Ser/Thr protein kinase
MSTSASAPPAVATSTLPIGTSTNDLPKGATIGRYLVVKRLGAGGMGVVYAAYDPELNRKVAIKLLHAAAGRAADSEGRMRLQREAQAMARLSHPNVIAVYDVGTAFEQVFVAMEFAEGGTLTDWLERGGHGWEAILEMFYQAGCGLQAAHAAGLVHRDFKPDNCLIGSDMRPRVVDFGLAREFKQGSATPTHAASGAKGSDRLAELPAEIRQAIANSQTLSSPMTQAGAIMGTPRYMAPEQFNGQTTDARTDVFTFCVVLYESLYGIQAFPGNSLGELALSVLEGKLQQPSDRKGVPSFIHKALLRGLSLDPAARFQTIGELLDIISPEARRKRRLGIYGVVGGIGLLLLATGVASAQQLYLANANRACSRADTLIGNAWGNVKAQAAAAMLATKAPYAKDVWVRVEGNVEKYLKEWQQARQDACDATFAQRKQPRVHLNLRLSCLENQLQEVAAFAELLRGADEEILDRAADASSDFSLPSSCADAIALNAQVPEQLEARKRVEDLYREIGAVRVMTRMGRYNQARERAQSLIKQAEQVHYAPATSRALAQLGNIDANAADFPSAERSFFSAAVAAIEGGDHRAAAQAYMELMRLVGRQFQQYELADRYHRLALAEFSHLRSGRLRDQIDGNLRYYACQVDTARGELARAEKNCLQGIKMHEQLYGSERTAHWLLSSLANVYRRQGRYDEAFTLLRQTLNVLEKSSGPEHPRTASALASLGNLFAAQGKYPEAVDYTQRALAIYRKTFGDNSPRLYESQSLLARWAIKQGQLEPALVFARQAFDSVRGGKDAARQAESHRLVGEVLYRQERYEDALTMHQAGLDLCDKKRCDPSLPALLAATADDLRELERGKEALPLAEQAERLLPSTADREVAANIHFTLARTLWLAGKKPERPRARTLAEQSRKLYRDIGKLAKTELAEVDAWLAKNR